MTQVDFYILGQRGGDRHRFACRLTEKAWRQGHHIYLHTASQNESRELEQLLWTYRQDSFLPHGQMGEADPALNPILVGYGTDVGEEHDVLINLAPAVPEFFSRFERVAEIIDQNEEARAAGRERFRFYRDRGYPLNSHEIEK